MISWEKDVCRAVSQQMLERLVIGTDYRRTLHGPLVGRVRQRALQKGKL